MPSKRIPNISRASDIHKVVLSGIVRASRSSTGVTDNIPLETLVTYARTQEPQAAITDLEIEQVLFAMGTVASLESNLLPVVEYDSVNKTTYINDPCFLFFLDRLQQHRKMPAATKPTKRPNKTQIDIPLLS